MAACAPTPTNSPKSAANYNSFASCHVGSRSQSPHFSPDRITRHASPSRHDLAQREVCIVPRIPQPYRTSFSAVTTLMRVPKAATSELDMPRKPLPINLLGAHKRTTSPGRITPMKPVAYQCPTERVLKQCAYSNMPSSLGVAGAETVVQFRGSEYPDIVQDFSISPPPDLDIKSIQTSACLPQDQPAPCMLSEMPDCTDTEDSSTALSSDINATADLGMNFDANADTELGNVETCDNNLKLNGDEVGHVKPTGHRKLFGKFRSFRSVGGTSSVNRSQDVPSGRYQKINNGKKDKSEGARSSESRNGRERSKTLPSQGVLDDASDNLERNQKSISMSITSFFKRMSPKSLRRFAFNSEKNHNNTGTSSDSFVNFGEFDCDNVPQSASGSSVPVDVSADGSGISVDSVVPLLDAGANPRRSRSLRKSPRMSPIKRLFRQRDSDTTNAERQDTCKHITEKCDVELAKADEADKSIDKGKHGLSGQTMTPEMNLILKSIEDHSTMAQRKSVYQTFKDKRSPVRTPEGTLGFKPQVLQAVEFPEGLLEPESLGPGMSNPGSGLSSSLPGLLDNVDEAIPVITFHNVASSGKVSCEERPNLEPTGRKHEPPRTLNVRSVQKVANQRFQFPSMSVESIGQCSLDVADAGSEASLVQNGHFSSTSASKRTLNSQENIADPVATRSALPCDNSCESLDKGDDATCDNATNFDDVESRTPSYLKLSRAIGGYTPYNTYVSIAEHERIRTEKSTCRSSGSPVTNELKGTEVVLQNGDAVVTVRQSCQAGGYGSTGQCPQLGVVGHVAGEPSPSNGFASRGNNRLSSMVCASVLVAGVPEQKTAPSSFVVADSGVSCDVPCVKLLPQAPGDCWDTSVGDALRNRSSFHKTFSDSADLPQKDGWFFLNLVDGVELRLKQKCTKTEQDLLVNTSEEVEGKLRATVGKANLLIKKKFQQFRQLCHASLDQSEDEPFKTTVEDLSGFWDMVLIQVEDVEKQFEEIDLLRQSGWKETKASENHDVATPTMVKTPGTKIKTPKSQTTVNSKSPSLSSSKSPAAAKAREEARRRLMAAKMAGRQRKASESDKDIEIFVS